MSRNNTVLTIAVRSDGGWTRIRVLIAALFGNSPKAHRMKNG